MTENAKFKIGDMVTFYVDAGVNPNSVVKEEGGFGGLLGYDGDYALVQVPADDDDPTGLSYSFNYEGETHERKSKLIRVRSDKIGEVPFDVAPMSQQEKELVNHLQVLHGLKPTAF